MRKLINITLALLLFSGLFVIYVNATGFEEMIPDISEGIPEDSLKYLPDKITSSESIKGNITFGFFFSILTKAFAESAPKVCADFSVLCGLIIISAVLNGFKNSLNSSLGSIAGFVSLLCVSVALLLFSQSIIDTAEKFITQIASFMGFVTPAVIALNILSGKIALSGVTSVFLSGATVFLEMICVKVIFPFIKVCLCLLCASATCDSLDVSGFCRTLKQIMKWLLGIITAILSLVLSFQCIIAKNADGAAVKSVKFAVGNSIPIVGNAVSDAVSTLAGGIKILSSSFGVGSAVIIIVSLVIPMAEILLYKLFIQLSAGVSGMIGLNDEKKLLNEIDSLLGFSIATMACVSVFFLFSTELLSSFN